MERVARIHVSASVCQSQACIRVPAVITVKVVRRSCGKHRDGRPRRLDVGLGNALCDAGDKKVQSQRAPA